MFLDWSPRFSSYYVHSTWVKVLVLALILLADWADGATARRYNRCSRSGHLLDVVTST